MMLEPGHGPAVGQRRAPRASAPGTRRRRTSAPTCGARSPPATSGSSRPPRRRTRIARTLETPRHARAPRRKRPVLQLVRPGHGREAARLAGRRQHRLPVPLERRQRLARRGADDGRATPCRRRAREAEAILADMDFGFYYDPAAGLIRGGVLGRAAARLQRARQLPRPRARRLLHVPPLRRAQHRAADRELHRHRLGPDPAHALLPHVAHVPEHVRLVVAGDAARGRDADLPRRRRVRGPLPVPRHAASSRAGAAACSRR